LLICCLPCWLYHPVFVDHKYISLYQFCKCRTFNCFKTAIHRRTVREGWGLQPPEWGKAIIFRANAKFFRQKPAAKNEKNWYLLNEKNGIHSIQGDKFYKKIYTQNLGFLLIIIGWGESGKAVLQVR